MGDTWRNFTFFNPNVWTEGNDDLPASSSSTRRGTNFRSSFRGSPQQSTSSRGGNPACQRAPAHKQTRTTASSSSFRSTGSRGRGNSTRARGGGRNSTRQANRNTVISAIITPQLQAKLQNSARFTAPFYTSQSLQPGWIQPWDVDWKWNKHGFVNLPFSSSWTKKRIENGQTTIVPRWSIIQESLSALKSFFQKLAAQNSSTANNGQIAVDFGKCVRNYNAKLAEICNFRILNDPELFDQLVRVVPKAVDMCLQIPWIIEKPLPLLRRGMWHTLYLTRRSCCSLLANAFFCTIPHYERDPNSFPHFHFLKLFHDGNEGPERSHVKVEKIKCVLSYIEQVCDSPAESDRIISFERRCLQRQVHWSRSRKHLCDLLLNSTDTIEQAECHVQADFANKFIGGGILSVGMVQEEIRFACCPDLIASRLFTEVLGDDEVLVMTGGGHFNSYTGYRTTFRMQSLDKAQDDNTDVDPLGREAIQLVAMDALNYKRGLEWTQYQPTHMDRELHKAYVAFFTGRGKGQKQNVSPVATGNWGCGAFNGDPELKMLIQWMAASEADRLQITYFTFGDHEFTQETQSIMKLLKKKHVSVGNLHRILGMYENQGNVLSNPGRVPVYQFVKQNI